MEVAITRKRKFLDLIRRRKPETATYQVEIPEGLEAKLPPQGSFGSWLWNSNRGKRRKEETPKQYVKRALTSPNFEKFMRRIGSEEFVLATEEKSVFPFRGLIPFFPRKYTELQFKVNNGKLVYIGYDDIRRKEEGDNVLVAGGEKGEKQKTRSWPGMKRVLSLLLAGVLSWPFATAGYTAADISLHKPEKQDVNRLVLLQKLIDARESGDIEKLKGALYKFHGFRFGEGDVYRVADSIILGETLNGTLPSLENILGKVELPIKLPRTTIIRGKRDDGLLSKLFGADLFAGHYTGNIVRYNEYFSSRIGEEEATTLLKEIGVVVYFNLPKEKRGEIREQCLAFAEQLLKERQAYFKVEKEMKTLDAELSEIFMKRFGCSYSSIVSTMKQYLETYKVQSKENAEKGAYNPELAKKVERYFELRKKVNELSTNPLIQTPEGKGLKLKRFTPAEIFSEFFAYQLAKDAQVVTKPILSAGMFGKIPMDKRLYFEFSNNPPTLSSFSVRDKVTIVDKSWDNFWRLCLINLNNTLERGKGFSRNLIFKIQNAGVPVPYDGEVYRDEWADLREIEELARKYSLE